MLHRAANSEPPPLEIAGLVEFVDGVFQPLGHAFGTHLRLVVGQQAEDEEQEPVELHVRAFVFHALLAAGRNAVDGVHRQVQLDGQRRVGPEKHAALGEVAVPVEFERFERKGDIHQRDSFGRRMVGVRVRRSDHDQIAGRKGDLLPVHKVFSAPFFDPCDLGIIVIV